MRERVNLFSTAVALLFVASLSSCSKKKEVVDPNAKFHDAQLRVGMPISEIKKQFGEPDKFEEFWSDGPGSTNKYFGTSRPSQKFPYHVEKLGYGPFGAHNQKVGYVTRYRMQLTFFESKLTEWEKAVPIDEK